MLITRKAFIIPVLYEFLLENIIDGGYTEVVAVISLDDRDYRRSERLDVKDLVFGEFFAGIVRDHIHLEILGYGRTAGWLNALIHEIIMDFGLGITAKL